MKRILIFIFFIHLFLVETAKRWIAVILNC